jgi:hypothetical protein
VSLGDGVFLCHSSRRHNPRGPQDLFDGRSCGHSFSLGPEHSEPSALVRAQDDGARAAAQAAAAAAAQAAAAEALTRATAAAGRELEACKDPASVRDVLVSRPVVRHADCRAAWLRLLASHELPATHEIVTLNGRKNIVALVLGRDGRGRWSEPPNSRIDAWSTHRADLWLDARGDLRRGGGGDSWVEGLTFGAPVQRSTCRVALPKGRRVIMRRESDQTGLLKWHSVVGASRLGDPWSDEETYSKAVVSILGRFESEA